MINSNTQSWLVAKSEQSTKLSKQSFPIWSEGLSEETFLFISTFGFHPYLLELKKNLVRNVIKSTALEFSITHCKFSIRDSVYLVVLELACWLL